MKVAIFGPRYSGKSTVFRSLTGLAEPQSQARQPVPGTVKVPDERVDYLASVYHPKKTTYAEILFWDMPGTEEGALPAKMAADLRNADVLTLVARSFDSPFVPGPPDPLSDFESMEGELSIWDLAVIEKRLERLAKEHKQQAKLEQEFLERCRAHLEDGSPLRTMTWTAQEEHMVRGYQFLSRKPLIVLVNTSEENPNDLPAGLESRVQAAGGSVMALCATMEAEIAELPEQDRRAFLEDLGQTLTARDRYIQHAYRALDLISFLTAGEDECRAWPISRGTTAKKAAGVIHSDIERGFIRAEVISFEDFQSLGGDESKARAAGRYRLEGKDYVIQDGDIVTFRFNV